MNNKPQKLELTWIGKENQPRLEPRILIEDPERSYPPTKIPTTPNPSLTKADQPPPAPSLTKADQPPPAPSLTKEGSKNILSKSSPPILGGDKGVVN